MYIVIFLFLQFFIYSLIGWIIETISCSIFYKKILNRGFLIGPYCPIYGISSIFMIIMLEPLSDDLFRLFILSAIIASLVEYIVSYCMEKLFKTRWWDYSRWPFNVNGRIHLLNALCFGCLGALLVKYINPFLMKRMLLLSNSTLYIISLFCLVILLIDIIVSSYIIIKTSKTDDMLKRDCSEEMKKCVNETLRKQTRNKCFKKDKISN